MVAVSHSLVRVFDAVIGKKEATVLGSCPQVEISKLYVLGISPDAT